MCTHHAGSNPAGSSEAGTSYLRNLAKSALRVGVRLDKPYASKLTVVTIS